MRLILAAIGVGLISGCSLQPWRGEIKDAQSTSFRAMGEPVRSQELVLHALQFIGVPYRYGGDSPDTGFDCSGLVWHVFQHAAGVALPRHTRAMRHAGVSVAREALQPGDLVFFNTLDRPFSHVGIYLGNARFVHAPARGGAVEIVSMAERYWRSRYDGARRISF